MITVDISNPNTDISHLRKLIKESYDKNRRRVMFEYFGYSFGKSDDISDETLGTLVDHGQEYGLTEGVDTIEEMRNEIEHQRKNNRQTGEHELLDSYLAVVKYIFLGKDREKAYKAQKKAISNGWNMNVFLSLQPLVD